MLLYGRCGRCGLPPAERSSHRGQRRDQSQRPDDHRARRQVRSHRQDEPGRINIFNNWQVRYWCLQLNCSERQLRTAVRIVGDEIRDVRSAILRGDAG